MTRWMLGVIAFVSIAVCYFARPVHAWTSVGERIRVGELYPGTSLKFQREPELKAVPDTKVYGAPGRNLYRYGRFWYFVEEGYWFRARSWSGPFIHIHSRSVPRSVRTVPAEYRYHWIDLSPRAIASDFH